jgi:fumarylpyruvate hydrolase
MMNEISSPPVASATLPVHKSTAPFHVRRVYCVGRNYVAHIREMKEGDERDPPFFFQKPSDAVVQPGQPVEYPPETSDLQYEVELVVAIGRTARDVPVASALDHVFGYAVGLDITRRDRQRESGKKGLPWEVGKSFDQSAPCGEIVPVAVCGHRMSGPISLTVNGETKQTGDLSHMIWNVPEIISNLSSSYVLMPGDIIYTGTPAGVGPVVPGDIIVSNIEGLPPLTTPIAARAR